MTPLTRLTIAVLALSFCAAGVASGPDGPHDMKFTPLADGIWMYTGHAEDPEFGSFAYNGVVAIDNAEAVVIDLPENGHDASKLFSWISQKEATIVYAVPQHWHRDSAGTLALMYERGIRIAMLDKTFELLGSTQHGRPDVIFGQDVRLKYGQHYVDLAYYGGGHSVDGIVAWFDDGGVLVGGCMLKAAAAESLGNLADADLNHYLSTVLAVKRAYGGARVVTPGHGPYGGLDVIDRTITLLETHRTQDP